MCLVYAWACQLILPLHTHNTCVHTFLLDQGLVLISSDEAPRIESNDLDHQMKQLSVYKVIREKSDALMVMCLPRGH